MKVFDLGLSFKVCFDAVLSPIEDIELWTHEFSEISIMDLLEEDYGINVEIDDPSPEKSGTAWVRIAHIMVALHTSSSIRYVDGSEKVFTPDEFTSQILDARKMGVQV